MDQKVETIMNEDKWTEWKESWRDEYLKWICGFANAHGGTLEIETWGRGIRKMQEDCKTYGIPGPKIWSYKTDICVEFKNHESNIKSKIPHLKKTHSIREKTREKTREKILYFITHHSKITIQELAYKTGLSIKGVEWQIQKLKKAGYLKRVGPAKGGHWQIIKKSKKRTAK